MMMLKNCLAAVLLFSVVPACASAQAATAAKPQPPVKDAREPAASQPTAEVSSGDAEVDQILDDLEQAGRKKRAITCKLLHTLVVVVPVDSRKKKSGELLFYRDDKQSRFKIHFNKLEADGIISRDEEFFAFDGENFIERNDKSKTITKRRIVRKGEKKDPFALGKGPFPLPFGQKRAEILRHFAITLAKFEIGDPPGSKHLHCVPRPGTDLADRYTRVEFYIDPSLRLPVRIVCERKSDGDRIEADFTDIIMSDSIDPKKFEVPRPAGFTETTEDLSDRPERINLEP